MTKEDFLKLQKFDYVKIVNKKKWNNWILAELNDTVQQLEDFYNEYWLIHNCLARRQGGTHGLWLELRPKLIERIATKEEFDKQFIKSNLEDWEQF